MKIRVFLTTAFLVALAVSCQLQAAESAGGLTVKVGQPRIIAQYKGPLSWSARYIADAQTYQYTGLLKAGNGNLIALYYLRCDEKLPEDVDINEYLIDNIGYRVSTDNGRVWSNERYLSVASVDGGTLLDGTVIIPYGPTWWVNEHELRTEINRTTDGGLTWKRDENVRVRFPADRFLKRRSHGHASMVFWVGPILQVDQNTLLATMNGRFAGKEHYHSVLVKSVDAGHSWDFVSCIAGDKKPDHGGYYGTALVRFADNSLLAVAQTQWAKPRILVQCRSYDGGKTWTDPITCPGIPGLDPAAFRYTDSDGKEVESPHTFRYTTPDGKEGEFSNAYQHPKLLRMENGVLVLAFGNPGIQVAFSSDGTGRKWDKIVTIVPLAARYSYGEHDVSSAHPGIVPLGPNRLLLLYDVYKYKDPKKSSARRNTIFVRELTINP